MTKIITKIPRVTPGPSDAHKGHFGRVLIMGGSRGMIGASAMTANAAFRSGAGLVRLAIPRQIQLATSVLTPCATSIALPNDQNGCINCSAINDILKAMENNDSVAVGPGLGQSSELQMVMKKVVSECAKPLIVDADGLNNLAAGWAGSGKPIRFPEETVLTPHPGEFRRLWQVCFRKKPPNERTEQAEKLAQHLSVVMVLKGAGTVVTNGRQTYINETGNPGMATGGAGDVLTGIIAALLARQNNANRLSALDAAILGVFVHGRAGDLAAATMTENALMATDLIDWLPKAWQSIEE